MVCVMLMVAETGSGCWRQAVLVSWMVVVGRKPLANANIQFECGQMTIVFSEICIHTLNGDMECRYTLLKMRIFSIFTHK